MARGDVVKLSVQSASLLLPGETLRDHVVDGLELRARGTVKSWHLYYRFNGTQRRPKLGNYPTLSIEQARTIAKEWHVQIARGVDPSAERQAKRHAATVADLADAYLAECKAQKARGQRGARTLEENERHVRLYIKPQLGKLAVADVSLADVNGMLNRIGKTAPVYANRVRDTLSGMMELAESEITGKLRPRGSNPCRDEMIVTFPEYRRERHATADELIALREQFIRLRDLYPREIAALNVILLTGSRVTELITAKRSEIRDGVITLQKHKTARTGEPRRIYLPRQALEVIESLPDDGSGYLFGAGLTRHDVHDVFDKARKAAGCPDLQVLDLRRTFASAGKSSGITLDAIGELFGHSDAETTRRYAWLFDDAARRNTQSVADVLTARMTGGG